MTLMPSRPTDLDKDWQELMFLCTKETEYMREERHPKVLELVRRQIESIAGRIGFSAAQIERRQFRAERDGDHITRILSD